METFCKNGATVIACVRKINKDFEKNVENLIKKHGKKNSYCNL